MTCTTRYRQTITINGEKWTVREKSGDKDEARQIARKARAQGLRARVITKILSPRTLPRKLYIVATRRKKR